MPKRVLLMYISYNSGHHRCSIAVERAIKALSPDTEVLNINGFNYTNPILERVINRTYMAVIKRKPQVWDYLYDNPQVFKKVQALRDFLHNMNFDKLKVLLDDFRPDAIACTQAFPCGMIADLKGRDNLVRAPLFGILTDYAPHSYWIYPTIDYFIVPDTACGEKLVQNGIDAGKVKPFGIPIDPKFCERPAARLVKLSLGLGADEPTALIMGGGQGYGPIKDIVSVLDNSVLKFQMLVVCGINARLFKWLNSNRRNFKKNLIPLEFVDNVNELMSISDIIVTKPGGMTTAEALAKGLPMIITNPIPGQESNNAQFLTGIGAAKQVDDTSQLCRCMDELLGDPAKLKNMRESAFRYGHPNAATDTANLILNAIGHK